MGKPEIPHFANPRGYRTGILFRGAKIPVLILVLSNAILLKISTNYAIINFK